MVQRHLRRVVDTVHSELKGLSEPFGGDLSHCETSRHVDAAFRLVIRFIDEDNRFKRPALKRSQGHAPKPL